MAQLILLNKPFQVLSQFSDDQGRRTLRECVPVPGVYPAGRLDWDSEGLLLLTDDGALQARISDPRFKLPKTYLVQLWPRNPPVRSRKTVPDSWLRLTIDEGRNRQVRRMTAAIGHPTLRLVRWQIGEWRIDALAPGEWRAMTVHAPKPPAARQRRPRHRSGGPRPKSSGPR